MSERKQLLSEIEAFLLKSKMSASRFGHAALNDKGFMTRFRRGADVRTETATHLRAFMEKESKRARPKSSVPRPTERASNVSDAA